MHLGLCSFDADPGGGARECCRPADRPRAGRDRVPVHEARATPPPAALVATDADPDRFADLPPAFEPGLPVARPIAPPQCGGAWWRG